MERAELIRATANTYGGDRDPWVRVEEYQRVIKYAAEYPSKKSAAVASALDLPRSRIRLWVDSDGMPDPMRGIQVCESHGWFDIEYATPPFTGLNVLVAWTFSGGSINQSFVPYFTIEHGHSDILTTAFDHVGVGYTTLREDSDGRATEIRPAEDASALGRLLVALGAPRGEKNSDARLTLPQYLDDAPFVTRLDFARTYLHNRGVVRTDRENQPIQFREERSDQYRTELHSFLRAVTGDMEYVRGNSDAKTTFLSPRGAGLLCETPLFGGFE